MQDIYFTDEQIKTTCSSSNINQWHPKKPTHSHKNRDTNGETWTEIITQVRAQ